VADNTLRFDIVGDASKASEAFTETASTADLAARGARRLAIAMEASQKATDASARASISLGKADLLLAEVERELSGEAQKDRDAQLADAEAKRINADASKKAARDQVSALASLRSPLAGIGVLPGLIGASAVAFGPQLLGAAAGVAGLGAAFGAAAVSAGAFGLVARTELTKVNTAQQKLAAAQAQYNKATTPAGRASALKAETAAMAGLSKSEQQLAKDLTTLKGAWAGLGKAEAPVVATAISPWVQAATSALRFFRPLVQDTGDGLQYLGNEARDALQQPFWQTFFSTLGHTGEVALIGFGEALGKLGDGFAHLFVTFAPDIDKLPALINKWAGSFDNWAQHVKTSGFDKFMKDTFTSGNISRIKDDVQAAGTLIANIAKAVGNISPAAFSGLSNVLTVLSKLSPGQIEAIGILYLVGKAAGGPGSLAGGLFGGFIGGKGKAAGEAAGAETAAKGASSVGRDFGATGALGELSFTIGTVPASNQTAFQKFENQMDTFRSQALIQASGIGTDIAHSLGTGFNVGMLWVATQVKRTKGFVLAPFGGAGLWLYSYGESVLDGFIAGMQARLHAVGNLAASIAGAAQAVSAHYGNAGSGIASNPGKHLAGGGVLTEPVYGWGARTGTPYMLGENGPEAVIPLGRGRGAAGVPSGGGGGQTVRLVVDGSAGGAIGMLLAEIIRDHVHAVGGGGPSPVQRTFGQVA